jgi:hypothetical protein
MQRRDGRCILRMHPRLRESGIRALALQSPTLGSAAGLQTMFEFNVPVRRFRDGVARRRLRRGWLEYVQVMRLPAISKNQRKNR